MAEHVVVDASAFVDLLIGSTRADAVAQRLEGCQLHAPAHLDTEVLSALARLHRAGAVTDEVVGRLLATVREAPVDRHPLPALLAGAWRRRSRLRLADALYVELATMLDVRLITTDERLARAVRRAESVTSPGEGGRSTR